MPVASTIPQQMLEHEVYTSRLNFLYKSVEDTQNTIRFIDTKAAFCVTLLSGLVAGVLQGSRGSEHSRLHEVFLLLFMIAIVFTLLTCLRVIFPVIKPHTAPPSHRERPLPKFFISHHRDHHWIRHSFSNSVDGVLSEDHDSYMGAVAGSTDEDLLHSMCDEVLMISLIRQIKSDRLHTAMFSLTAAVVLFPAAMLL